MSLTLPQAIESTTKEPPQPTAILAILARHFSSSCTASTSDLLLQEVPGEIWRSFRKGWFGDRGCLHLRYTEYVSINRKWLWSSLHYHPKWKNEDVLRHFLVLRCLHSFPIIHESRWFWRFCLHTFVYRFSFACSYMSTNDYAHDW